MADILIKTFISFFAIYGIVAFAKEIIDFFFPGKHKYDELVVVVKVKNSEKTVLLDFYADWCGPCRMVSPIVDEIAEEYPQYLVAKINVDDEPELAESFSVTTIPTLVVMKGGKVISQSSGARPKEQILNMLEG